VEGGRVVLERFLEGTRERERLEEPFRAVGIQSFLSFPFLSFFLLMCLVVVEAGLTEDDHFCNDAERVSE